MQSSFFSAYLFWQNIIFLREHESPNDASRSSSHAWWYAPSNNGSRTTASGSKSKSKTTKGSSSEACGKFNERKKEEKNRLNKYQLFIQVKIDNISIEDALKNEIDDKSMKTPISILQELLSRRGITPNYELVQIEGAVHKPMFKYRVSFNDKEAFGCGPSKKQAKHNCAKALISVLTGTPLPSDEYDGTGGGGGGNGTGASNGSAVDQDDDKVTGNPIGQLQELCMSRKWPPPTYETEMEVGLPHARQFTIACYVLNHHEVGNGKSKKIAKRNAANKMLQKLKDIPIDSSLVIQMTDEDGNDIKGMDD